jgi:hypothetical protein
LFRFLVDDLRDEEMDDPASCPRHWAAGGGMIGFADSGTNPKKETLMKSFRIGIIVGSLVLASAAAQTPGPSRVRGTITSLDGNVLSVKSRDGQDLKIELAPNATFAYMKKMDFADIKPGTPLGTTAVKDKDGNLVARELHLFNPDKPIPSEGHRPWDTEPNSTMTNAKVTSMANAKVEATNGRVLTLTYKDGEQRVLVPEGIPVVMAVDGDRSLVKPGEYAFIAVNAAADGKLTAMRVQVSKDGVKPPQ